MNAREYISFLRPVISKAYAKGIEHNAKTMLSGPNAYGTGNTAPNANYSTRYLDYGQPVPAGYQWMYDPLDANKVDYLSPIPTGSRSGSPTHSGTRSTSV